MNSRARLLACLLVLVPVCALAEPDLSRCQPLDINRVLPYHDIRDPGSSVNLGTVETNHFIKDVELLRRGQTSPLPYDISFVLRAFPNHYRALNSMAMWQLKNNLPEDPKNELWTADCYFLRALDFVPDDWKVNLVYGVYLHKAKRLDEAQKQYEEAEQKGADSADYWYNRGLLEVDMGHLTKAQECADKAYEQGASLPGLKMKLARALSAQNAQGKPKAR